MRNHRNYRDTFFPVAVLSAALAQLEKIGSPKDEHWSLSTLKGNSQWDYDNVDEFYAGYRLRPYTAHFARQLAWDLELAVHVLGNDTQVEVAAPDRAKIESVFTVFENAREASRLPKPTPEPPPKPVIFIGHGRSPLWRSLKDHLHEQHGHRIEAYETGARAGHTIRDILSELVKVSSFALLVLTAEDEQADGTMHARENVIHEAGLFQGRLGYERAIVLLEEGRTNSQTSQACSRLDFRKGIYVRPLATC